MSEDQLLKAKDMATVAAKKIGKKLRANWGQIDHKSKTEVGQVVTELDHQTELFLAKQFKKFDNSIGFRGEEFGTHQSGKRTWLVDPIDGTIHFIRGLPFCTTMISLIEDGQVVIGIIHDFVADQTYWAIKGQGAFKDSQPIKVSDRHLGGHSLIGIETSKTEIYLKARRRLRGEDLGKVLITCNSGWELAMVACGKMDARVVCLGFGKDYDYAAGSLIVQEAGGIVRNLGSTGYDYTNCNHIAASAVVYHDLDKQGLIELLATNHI